MGQVAGANRLRARLLVGVATVALAAPATNRALAQQAADKYQAHVEAGGLITNDHSGGDVDLFLPLWQDPTSLLFGDLRGTFTGQPAQSGSFGLGYRTQVDPEWILGGYGFFDLKHTDDDNTFLQGSVGLEALSVDWDFRVNGYFPFNSDSGSKSEQGTGGLGGSGLTIIGTDIGFHTTTEQEKALFGVDGEVGWRVPIFPADGDVDVRVFAGGFYYTASDVDALAGPRGRIEVRLYDLDFLGVQSRLTAQGLVQWDAERGTIGGGGLELRIPLGGFFGDPETKLSALDRRMVDRVVRNPDVIQTATAKTDATRLQDVIVDGLTVSTHKIVFADGTGTAGASGTQANPTDLNSAPGKFPGQNEIIVAQGDNGPLNVNNPVQLQDGQALLGGGTPVGVTLVGGPKDGQHIIFTPPGTRPTVVGNNAGVDLIEMASGSQNRVTGLDLQGAFANGIAGQNMVRAIITDNNVTGGARNGIYLQRRGSGVPPFSYTYIARNGVFGNAHDGIRFGSYVTDGQSHSELVWIADNFASGNGDNGIAVTNTMRSAGTTLGQNLYILFNTAVGNGLDGIRTVNRVRYGAGISQFINVIAGNDVEDNFDNGILVSNEALDAGSHINQYTVLALNLARSNGGAGIELLNDVQTGATVDQTAAVGLINQYGTFGNTVTDNRYDGIQALNQVRGSGASVGQTLAVVANSAAGNGTGPGGIDGFYRNGIDIGNFATGGGAVSQAVDVFGNDASGNSGNGIALWNIVEDNAAITRTGDLSGNFVSANGSHGILLYNGAGNSAAVGVAGGSIVESLGGTSNTVTANATDGVRLANKAFFGGSNVSQTVALHDSTITGNGSNGVNLLNNATSGGAFISQAVTIDPSIITGNGGHGIYGLNSIVSASLAQRVAVLNNTISYNVSDGLRLVTYATAGSVVRDITVAGNQIVSNGVDGVFIRDNVTDGSSLSQAVAVGGNTVSDHTRGVYIAAIGWTTSAVSQSVAVTSNIVANDTGNAIKVVGQVHFGGSLTQSAAVTDNTVTSAGQYGIVVEAFATVFTSLTQQVDVSRNTVSGTGSDGIYVRAHGISGANTATVGITVSGNSIADGGDDGIEINTRVSSAAIEAGLAIDNNTISNQSDSGILVYNIASIGTISQTGTINDNLISSNGGSGIALYNNITSATVTQLLTIDPNTIVHNGQNGIFGSNNVTSGTLNQSLGILGNTISYNGSDGIRILTTSAVASTLSQGLSIGGNTIAQNSSNGVFVSAQMFSNSTLSQTASLTDNTITDGAGYGIALIGHLRTSGTIVQTVTATGNAIADFGSDGILARSRLYGTGLVSQTVSIGANTLTGFGRNGIDVGAFETSGTTLSQTATVTNNVLSGISAQGIRVTARDDAGSSFGQSVSVTGNTVGNTGDDGIHIATERATASPAGVAAIAVDGNSLTSIGGHGILVRAELQSATLGETSFEINSNSVVHASSVGIYVVNRIDAGGVLTQGVSLANALINDNFVSDTGSAGIFVRNRVSGAGATLSQALTIDPNTVIHAHYAGIGIETRALYGGSATQALAILDNTVSDVQALTSVAVGVGVRNIAGSSGSAGAVSQSLSIGGNSISDVGSSGSAILADGIGLFNDARASSTISQSVAITTNTIADIYGGISAFGVQNLNVANNAGSRVSQTLSITGNSITQVHGQGFVAGIGTYNVLSRSGAGASQALVISSNTISEIGRSDAVAAVGIVEQNAVGLRSTLSLATDLQSNSIAGVTAGGVASGIALYTRVDARAFASQAVTIGGNQISSIATLDTGGSNGAAGISVITYLEGSGAGAQRALATQALLLSGNAISQVSGPNASAAGIFVLTGARTFASDGQTLTLLDNTVTNGAGDGIVLVNAAGPSGVISQGLALGSSGAGNLVSGMARDGISLQDTAFGGTISQTGGIVDNQSLYNSGTGLTVNLSARGGAGTALVTQGVSVTGNTLNGNGVGLGFAVAADSGGGSYSAIGNWATVQGNTIQHNVGAGSFGVQGASASQLVDMSAGGNTITSNGLLRFVVYASAGVQDVRLSNGVNGNTMNGANIVSAVGGATQNFDP